MQLIIQRVKSAEVMFEGNTFSSIGQGFLVYIGIDVHDNEKVMLKVAKKLKTIKLYEESPIPDEQGFLFIANFITLGQMKGNRITYHHAMEKSAAKKLYEFFLSEMRKLHPEVKNGCYGEYTHIKSIVDGPFNLLLQFKNDKQIKNLKLSKRIQDQKLD